ncbi:MAG: HEAT repeat domain-containing protein, partial [Planctomycetes bacterium]|nr:HEAT repeat domain-containing protein [Planctomycetota bacterium]
NGFASGGAALERLAHDIDPEIRRRAAAAMAETGDRAFLPTLVALLNDPTLGVRKTTVDALVALNGTDISVKAGEPLPSLSERIRRWQAWYENQPPSTASR